VTKRLADIATDLFVGMCVLSRVSSYISEKGEGASTAEIEIAKIYTQMARVRIANNFRGLFSNADKQIVGLSDYIKEAGGYPWDTI
jgi:hypothetical protein